MRPASTECLERTRARTFGRKLLNEKHSWANQVSASSNAGPPARDQDRLTGRDKSIIAQAHQLVGVSGAAAVPACFGGIAVSYADTAHEYAEALSQATWVIGELLAIIERFADGGAGVTVPSERDEPSGRSQPESGDQSDAIRAGPAIAPAGIMPIGPRTYEITFTGRAGAVLCAAFEDCTVTTGPGMTTLRAELPDQAALWGLVQRIIGLGLEVVDLHLGTRPARLGH